MYQGFRISFFCFYQSFIRVSGIFQKSPDSHVQPARRHKLQTHSFWVFFMNRLAAEEDPLGDANKEANFG